MTTASMWTSLRVFPNYPTLGGTPRIPREPNILVDSVVLKVSKRNAITASKRGGSPADEATAWSSTKMIFGGTETVRLARKSLGVLEVGAKVLVLIVMDVEEGTKNEIAHMARIETGTGTHTEIDVVLSHRITVQNETVTAMLEGVRGMVDEYRVVQLASRLAGITKVNFLAPP